MSFAGHNRGKKFVRGVGYRFPEQEKKTIPTAMCDRCGAVATVFYSTGLKVCDKCDAEEDAGRGMAY